jgi:hypothetical protein
MKNMFINPCIMNYGLDLAANKINGLFFLMNGNFLLSFKLNKHSSREIGCKVVHYHDQNQRTKYQ